MKQQTAVLLLLSCLSPGGALALAGSPQHRQLHQLDDASFGFGSAGYALDAEQPELVASRQGQNSFAR